MRRTLFAAAIAISSLALTANRAEAQFRSFPSNFANPYQQAGFGQLQPGFGQFQPGFGQFQPGFGQPIGGQDVAFVQSLYMQYLGRYPDPIGLQTWVNRLALLGGDTNRLTQEFIQSSQRELNTNNPYSPWNRNRGRW